MDIYEEEPLNYTGIRYGLGIVYVFRCQEFMKIGFTQKPLWKRLSVVKTHCPYPVTVIRETPGYAAQEAWLHTVFRQLRAPSNNGWYIYDERILTISLPKTSDVPDLDI